MKNGGVLSMCACCVLLYAQRKQFGKPGALCVHSGCAPYVKDSKQFG